MTGLAIAHEALQDQILQAKARSQVLSIRGLGSNAHPDTYGHGGAGTSYSWADPASGVSFTYLTNKVVPDPWHSARLDRVSNLIHAAID